MIKAKIYKTVGFNQKNLIQQVYELLGDKIVAHTERDGQLTSITVKTVLTLLEKTQIETLMKEKFAAEEEVEVPEDL